MAEQPQTGESRDAARAIGRLGEGEQGRMLRSMPPEQAADVIEEMPQAQAAGIIEHLRPDEAAAIVSRMASDEQADVIQALGAADAEAVLAKMRPEDARDARRLASYPPEAAGGVMVTEFLAYPHTTPVRDVIEDMLARADEYSEYDVQYLYVVDSRGRLVGVVRPRDLLLQKRERPISEIMLHRPVSVEDTATLDELAAFFDAHRFVGAPVTDARGRLAGVVRRHDVEEALASRAGKAYMRAQGIVGGEELRTMKLPQRAARRLSWLVFNILLNILAASVIALYEETLAAVIALVMFLPIISDMSGSAGTQAVAVSVRELSLGLVKPRDLAWVLAKEAGLGVLNGTVLGLLIAGVAWAWKGSAWLGLIVGGALGINTVVAVTVGGTLPLVLRGLKFDPALASGVILTTVTDVVGFFLALSFATLLLARLVAAGG
jgi:magnesium transporter